jgi:RNA polymerase sigma-70 factor (ECF subfamily)
VIDASSRGAWNELAGKLRPFVSRRVRSSVDVDDVVQDVFLRMQRGLAGLRDDERFGPWVYQVARSAIIDHRRAATRSSFVEAELSDGEAPAHELEDDAVVRALAACVRPFVALLPPPYREAMTLTELEGRTQKEAAALLGISLSGMKSRVQRGRAQLRERFEECCEIALDARGRVIACEPRAKGAHPNGCCR